MQCQLGKKIIYDSNSDKFMGYCDFGNFHVESQETPASGALVFMLVSLNGKRKWPIGYFFNQNLQLLYKPD